MITDRAVMLNFCASSESKVTATSTSTATPSSVTSTSSSTTTSSTTTSSTTTSSTTTSFTNPTTVQKFQELLNHKEILILLSLY